MGAALLLAKNSVVGERGLYLLAKLPFYRRVGHGHQGQVGFAPDLQTLSQEEPHGDLGRPVGQSTRERHLMLIHPAKTTARSHRGISGSLVARHANDR